MTHPDHNARALLKMANQISMFFESQTPEEPTESARALAGHLRQFWAPTMRRALVEQFAHGAPPDARPLVTAAVRAHGDELRGGEPPPAE